MENQTVSFFQETHWEKAAKTRMGKYLTHIETDFILRMVDLSKLSAIMDIGAEAGRFSLMTTTSNVTMMAIDIDAYSLRRLRLKNQNVAAVQADARKIPVASNSFDGLFMIEVLDYIPQIDLAIGECYRILKANSPLVLSFGNQSSLKGKLRGWRGKSYMHSYRKVMNSLTNNGFKVTSKLGYNWLPFGRTSQNRIIPFLASCENLLQFQRIPSLSPWVIIHAIKHD